MNIVVLIKESPDMDRVLFDRERGIIDRASAGAEINPFDLYALQAAVDLRERYGGQVTAVSMGPPGCAASLRDAWARGADACILVTDPRIGGSDTLATSRVLAAAVARMDFDLILCGEKTVDGDTAQVGAEVAELLDIPHSYYVHEISDISKGFISLVSANICGANQRRRMKLPALVSVVRHIAAPKLPALKRKMDSLSVDIEKLSLSDINVPEDKVGIKGSPTRVSKIVVPKITVRESKIFKDDVNGFIETLRKAI